MANEFRLTRQSLCALAGLTPESEIRFRRDGVNSCRQLADEAEERFSKATAARVRASYCEMETALSLGMCDWAVNHLPSGHKVRALEDVFADALFYDIETDGCGRGSEIACITAHIGGETAFFHAGEGFGGFLGTWARARALVGFNIKRFDTPMVCRRFGLSATPVQIDLMDEARHYGYRGGLKAIEKMIGYERAECGCKDGEDAVRHWKAYKEEGDEGALEELRRYNLDDVLSLVALHKKLLKLSLENTFIKA